MKDFVVDCEILDKYLTTIQKKKKILVSFLFLEKRDSFIFSLFFFFLHLCFHSLYLDCVILCMRVFYSCMIGLLPPPHLLLLLPTSEEKIFISKTIFRVLQLKKKHVLVSSSFFLSFLFKV